MDARRIEDGVLLTLRLARTFGDGRERRQKSAQDAPLVASGAFGCGRRLARGGGRFQLPEYRLQKLTGPTHVVLGARGAPASLVPCMGAPMPLGSCCCFCAFA